MTVDDETVPRRPWRVPREGDLGLRCCAVVLGLFLIRDTTTGALRYALAQVGLSSVWFVPDVLCIFALGWFAARFAYRERSPWAILLLLSAFASTIMGWLFMASTPFALISSIKLFTPFVLGCCFAGRSLNELRWIRWLLTLLMIASVVGVILNPYVNYPWFANTIDNFGFAKSTGRVWWTDSATMRYGGIAGESTMAAFMCVFPLTLLYRNWPRWVQIVALVPIWDAIRLSTSKTALGVFFLFVGYYALTEFILPAARRVSFTRALAFGSFACVPMPFLLMTLVTGIDLSGIDPRLYSLQDRINNTWRFPFTYMSQHFPVGLFSGCGLGCFTYPMQYTGLASLWVPVDSFFVATYVMMGLPFVALVIGMATAPAKSRHLDKLLLMAITNAYVVTVQGYGPSSTTILIGYAVSDMFLRSAPRWRRERAQRLEGGLYANTAIA